MLQDATTGPTDVLETKASSLPQIQETSGASNGNAKQEDDDDDDDLPEFDFNSACGEPEAPINRFPGRNQQTHFPNVPPLNEKSKASFEATWTAGDPTAISMKTKSFPPSSLPVKLTNSNEGSPFAKSFGRFVSEKTPPTEAYHQLPSQPSSLKETKDFGNNPRHGFRSERRSLWDDDDDDMPEWCPPDLDLPKQPPPSASASARLLSGRPQSHDLRQRSQQGLLGPRPTSDAPGGGFVGFSDPPKPPLGSRHRDSVRSHGGRFSKRPAPQAPDGKRHRR